MPRRLLPVALMLTLAACAGEDKAPDSTAAAAATPAAVASGTLPGVTAEALPQALAQAYTVLAESAQGQPAEVFQAKATAAGTGALPEPEAPVTPDLHRAEAALRIALANNAGAVLPREAATAQAAYDCWAVAERTGAPPSAAVDCRALFGSSIRELWARS